MDGRFDVKFTAFDKNTGTIKLIANYVPPLYPLYHINLVVTKFKAPMKDNERALLQALMFQEGVLPIEVVRHDMRRYLDQMSPDDARKVRRKFRKLWRKLARSEESGNPLSAKIRTRIYGQGKTQPNRDNLEARKRLVQEHFLTDLIRPILDNYENGRVQRSEDTDEVPACDIASGVGASAPVRIAGR